MFGSLRAIAMQQDRACLRGHWAAIVAGL